MVKVASNTIRSKKIVDENFRFERKFIYEGMNLEDVIEIVLSNSFCFKEIFVRRKINNIYFDDNNYSFYHQNVSGTGEREKFRLRWYGNNFSEIKNPTFEIKKKYGEVGDKISFKLEDFSVSLKNIAKENINALISNRTTESNGGLISKFNQLQPTLYNSYERKYYLSFCGKYRITLDFNQEFFDPNYTNFLMSKKVIDEKEIVLELKYSIEHDNEARHVAQELNTRLTKNSKYVNGVDMINYIN